MQNKSETPWGKMRKGREPLSKPAKEREDPASNFGRLSHKNLFGGEDSAASTPKLQNEMRPLPNGQGEGILAEHGKSHLMV